MTTASTRPFLFVLLSAVLLLLLAECVVGQSALSCPGDGYLRTTPAFIGQQTGFLPNYQQYEYRDEFYYNGQYEYFNSEQVPIAAVGGYYGFESDNNGNAIAEWYLPSDAQSLAGALAYEYGIDFAPTWYSDNYEGVYNDNGGYPAVEASLDMDALLAFCPQCRSGIFPIDDPDDGYFLDVFVDMYDSEYPPLAASCSYIYFCDSCLGSDFLNYYDNIFMQLASIGVSVMVASGDDGTNGGGNDQCQNDMFSPGYPASSPYVTTVGATDYLGAITQDNVLDYFSTSDGTGTTLCGTCANNDEWTSYCQTSTAAPQQAVGIFPGQGGSYAAGFTSGGGFSGYAGQPSWQSNVVNAYLDYQCADAGNCYLPESSYYISGNRGFPDVSMFGGTTFPLAYNGYIEQEGGTSLSAPSFTAIIAQIIQAAIEIDGQPLGFLNPTAVLVAGEHSLHCHARLLRHRVRRRSVHALHGRQLWHQLLQRVRGLPCRAWLGPRHRSGLAQPGRTDGRLRAAHHRRAAAAV